jgi:type II secretory pathway predicted ATPase ExeA
MHEQHFKFSQRPFNVCPQVDDFFPGQSHQQTVESAIACIERRNGPVILIGCVGSGKSLTLQVIGDRVAEEFEVVSIECSRLEQRSELLQSILFELDLPFREMSEGELRLSLIDFLKNSDRSEGGILLLVDEADRLSIELLDELRLITNVVKQGRSQVQLVLAGTQRLEESLNDPRLASFNQRVAARNYLQHLSRDEVASYIDQHLVRAESDIDTIFDSEAVQGIAKQTDGCPRLINQLCEKSLSAAAEQDTDRVTAEIVQRAWADLQNLPVPTNQTVAPFDVAGQPDVSSVLSTAESTESVVEFGSLDDDGDIDSQFEADSGMGDLEQSDEASDSESGHFSDASSEDSAVSESVDSAKPDDVVEDNWLVDQDDENFDPLDPASELNRADFATEQNGDSAEFNDSIPSWDGRLPTNLGVHQFQDASDPPKPGFEVPLSAAYPGAGDPFAPAEGDFDAETHQQSDPRVEALEREQEALIKQVDQGTYEPVEAESFVPDATDDTVDFEDSQFAAQSQTSDADDPEGVGIAGDDNVEAAFEGLEQIDEARSNAQYSQAQDSGERAADPFAEDFEEEVMIHDAYSPFVARQNQSSLNITSDNLSHLIPRDELEQAASVEDSSNQSGGSIDDDVSETFASLTSESGGEIESDSPLEVTQEGEGDAEAEVSRSEFAAETEEDHFVDDSKNDSASGQDDLTEMPTAEGRFQFTTPATADAQFDPAPSVSSQAGSGASDNEQAWDEPKIDAELAALTMGFPFDDESTEEITGQPSEVSGVHPASESKEEASGHDSTVADDHADNDSPSELEQDQSARPEDSQRDSFNEMRDQANAIMERLRNQSPTASLSVQEAMASANLETTDDDPSHQVLRELKDQQQYVQQGQVPTSQADSTSVEYPITEHANYQQGTDPEASISGDDDRDMLRVNETQFSDTPQASSLPPSPLTEATPSTGQAKRVDYSQLFDQLRNLPKE